MEMEHLLIVPLVWGAMPRSGDGANKGQRSISIFCREVWSAQRWPQPHGVPLLLYLEGGPGFPAPRPTLASPAWLRLALDDFRVLLMDQRGTGRSTPLTADTLAMLGSAEHQAEYASHFRADAVASDCEALRLAVGGADAKLTLLGQSYGGFCALSYLSRSPASIDAALLTCGLAPVGQRATEVYSKTFARMAERNRRFYQRYPEDVARVREIVRLLRTSPAKLPGGGVLTARRFLQLGLLLGSSTGFDALHYLLEYPFVDRNPSGAAGSAAGPRLSFEFLRSVEMKQSAFETNIVYTILHESIYADGQGEATAWAADAVLKQLAGSNFDVDATLGARAEEPVYFTGEMVFPWMMEDYAALRPLKEVADILAAKADWPPLYNMERLFPTAVNVAALVSYDDIYVERQFSEEVARKLGDRCLVWVTNQYAHSGLRDDASVFKRLLDMTRGDRSIPS